MVGRAVSSRTPTDFHPRSVSPVASGQRLAVDIHTVSGKHAGWPHWAVGINSAVLSAKGLPSILSSSSRMLSLVTPPEVRSIFMVNHDFRFGAEGRRSVAATPPASPRTSTCSTSSAEELARIDALNAGTRSSPNPDAKHDDFFDRVIPED